MRALLQSIREQSFFDFEVVVTDDSPNDAVAEVCQKYTDLPIRYHKNNPALGTPTNWNEAMRLSSGSWIKIMHDDDWFRTPAAMGRFAAAIDDNPTAQFFFSAYVNVNAQTDSEKAVRLNRRLWHVVRREKEALFAFNLIGPPSVTLFRKNPDARFDERYKWVVDMAFYIQFLKNCAAVYINEPLINVGISNTQVTATSLGFADVQLRESLMLLDDVGHGHFKNILFFDAWWRLLRNFDIRSAADLLNTGYTGSPQPSLLKIVAFQQRWPRRVLTFGPGSKLLMLLCYLQLRSQLA